MISLNSYSTRRFRSSVRTIPTLSVALGFALLSSWSLHAKPIPDNLGNGLDKVVESHFALKTARQSGAKLATFAATDGESYTTQQADRKSVV